MTTYKTGNSIGSADPRDLYDNAQVIDDYANSDAATTTDRLGVERATIAGIDAAARDAIANAGYEFVGDYAAGIELTAYNQVVRDTSGEFWRVSGSTALPYTTTGAGLPEGGAFVTVGDAALRQELAAGVSTGQGGMLVSGAVIYADGLAELQAIPAGALRDKQIAVVDKRHYDWVSASDAWRVFPMSEEMIQEYQPAGPAAYAAMDPLTDELDGDSVKAFPSAVRYQGSDYVFYRSATAHVGSDGKIMLSVVDVVSGKTVSTQTVHNESGVDARDPCVLRDDFGEAVLVGGVMKIAVFKPNDGIYIYDWNPSSVANSFANGVKVNVANAIALRSDFRVMKDGVTYALVGYSAGSAECYWITTTDFITFSEELIGDGNEAAWCETSDGYINVIARNDVGTISPHAIIYKRLASGGAWQRSGEIRRTLNAPTLAKLALYRGDDTRSQGWLLLARDKTGRVGLSGDGAGRSSLIAMWSKDDHGRSLNDFDRYQVLAASPLDTPKAGAAGDAHYATAIASRHGTEISIYTYAYNNDDYWAQDSSFGTKIWKIDAWFKPGDGIITTPYRVGKPNLLRNGDFREEGRHWDISSNAVTIATPSDASNPVMRVDGYVQGGGSSVQATFPTEPGKAYRLFARIRRVSGGASNNRHTYFIVNANSQDLRTTHHESDPALDAGAWHILRSTPFIATADSAVLLIRSINTAAVSEISEVYVAAVDDYTGYVPNESEGRPIELYRHDFSAGLSSGGGGRTAVFTYSSSFWSSYLGLLTAGGVPVAASSREKCMVEVINPIQSGNRLIVTGVVIEPDWRLNIYVEIPAESTATITGDPLLGFVRVVLA